jgi:hypothetical protein
MTKALCRVNHCHPFFVGAHDNVRTAVVYKVKGLCHSPKPTKIVDNNVHTAKSRVNGRLFANASRRAHNNNFFKK